MSETWIPWAIRRPGPPEKAGYDSAPVRSLSQILYIVNHSAEGWEDYLREGHRPGERASWTFSNCQDGDFYQHYPLEAITYTSGGLAQNRDGLAVEHEGVAGQPLNAKQVANDRRLRETITPLCPNLRAPILGLGYREHSELTNGATTCPSGRIQPLYDSYKEDEDDMDEETKLWIATTNHRVAWLMGEVPGQTESGVESLVKKAGLATKAQVAALVTGGGLTAAAVVALFAEKLAG